MYHAKGGQLCHFKTEKSKQLYASSFTGIVVLHILLPALKILLFIGIAQKEVVSNLPYFCMKERRRGAPQLFTALSLSTSTLDIKEVADALCEESLSRAVLVSN